jgi:DDE superfamily endonuclease
VELYTAPPPGSTVICADELGPVIPRTFPPAPGWSPGGHRIKAPLEYSRGPEKTWVYGGLRVADGHAVTMCAPSRNSAFYQDFLQLEEQANPDGMIYVITDNLSSHDSKSTRAWLEDHPRIRHAFIPKRACWLNMQEGWWRIFRRHALAGQELRRPRRDRPRHPGGYRPAQRPCPALDLGTTRAQTPFLPPTLYIHPLRNVALGVSRPAGRVPSWQQAAVANWPAIASLMAATVYGAIASAILPAHLGFSAPRNWGAIPLESWLAAGACYLALAAAVRHKAACPSVSWASRWGDSRAHCGDFPTLDVGSSGSRCQMSPIGAKSPPGQAGRHEPHIGACLPAAHPGGKHRPGRMVPYRR